MVESEQAKQVIDDASSFTSGFQVFLEHQERVSAERRELEARARKLEQALDAARRDNRVTMIIGTVSGWVGVVLGMALQAAFGWMF